MHENPTEFKGTRKIVEGCVIKERKTKKKLDWYNNKKEVCEEATEAKRLAEKNTKAWGEQKCIHLDGNRERIYETAERPRIGGKEKY